jgi:hypothetical protein
MSNARQGRAFRCSLDEKNGACNEFRLASLRVCNALKYIQINLLRGYSAIADALSEACESLHAIRVKGFTQGFNFSGVNDENARDRRVGNALVATPQGFAINLSGWHRGTARILEIITIWICGHVYEFEAFCIRLGFLPPGRTSIPA